MESQIFTRSCRKILTIDEKLAIGAQMADAVAKREAANEELKAVKASYNNRIAAAEAAMGECQRWLNNGWRMEDVDVYWLMDVPRVGMKSIIRTDTGETIETEKMSQNDTQKVLDFQAGGNA